MQFIFKIHLIIVVVSFFSFTLPVKADELSDACNAIGYQPANFFVCQGTHPNTTCAGVISCSCKDYSSTTRYGCCQKNNTTTNQIEYACASFDLKWTSTAEPDNTYVAETTPTDIDQLKPAEKIYFVPQVTIPGSITIGGKEFRINKGVGIEITGSTAAQYFAVFYRFFVAALAVIAIVMVMWGGYKRIMAAGSPEGVKNANETIMGAITGVVIALLSYSLLSLVNPALVSLKPLDIFEVKREDIDFGGDIASAGPVALCGTPKTLRGDAAASEIVTYGGSFAGKVTYNLGAKNAAPCNGDSNISKSCNGAGHPAGQVCFDCSGFVSYVYKCITGIEVPSYSTALTSWAGTQDIVRVPNMADLMPGDIYGWGQKKTGGNSGHVLLVHSRSNNKPTTRLDVHGSCTVNGACGTSDVNYGTLANKCLEDGSSSRCFYLHLKRDNDFTVSCQVSGSSVPCGLRSPAGSCEYKEYDEYVVSGLSGKYKVGRLSGGCVQK